MMLKHVLVRVSVLSLMVSVLAACGTAATWLVPDEASVQKITAREFGVEPQQVIISSFKAESDGPLIATATVYYDAKIKGQDHKCYLETGLGSNNPPMCARPGESLTKSNLHK
jgi:hypothetical protein